MDAIGPLLIVVLILAFVWVLFSWIGTMAWARGHYLRYSGRQTALNLLGALSADCTANNTGSKYGKAQAAANFGMLVILSAVVFGLIGLTRLLAIFG